MLCRKEVAGNHGEVLRREVVALRGIAAGFFLECYFNTSGNNFDYYPATPFQILYADWSMPGGANTFTVKTGTRFFVPVTFIDDSPPILGNFPDDEDDIGDYVFARNQLGAHDLQIVVDGKTTTLGRSYAAGVHAPGLFDGGGSNLVQIGAFLTPLSKGIHTVTIRGTFDGDVILDLFGAPSSFEISYTVIVK